MKTLPLTVLVWEGPQARAYLVRMRRAGLRPRRIIVMVADALTKVGGGPVLDVARRRQDRRHNFHAYAIRKKHPALVTAIAAAVEPLVPDAAGFIAEMFDDFSYERYADRVDVIAASKYGDANLHQTLVSDGAVGTVLFTGGGLVPQSVFDLPGIRLIHVHTGFLPHVRGADVLLWSVLVRGCPGVSAFLMTPGLDDGDTLAARECPPLEIALPRASRPDDDTLYRALFCFIDPLYRAEILVSDVLVPAEDVDQLVGAPQDLEVGVTYHFMHPTVRTRALEVLFPTERLEAATVGAATTVPTTNQYAKYYEKSSVVAPLRFWFDAARSKNSLRAVGLRNRQHDYGRIVDKPALMPVHREINALLARQHDEWDTYDYGEGYHYQSSDELGITGLRDTTGRVTAFDLCTRVAGKTVLEIGCNTGFIAVAIAGSAQRVVGFELNPLLIDIANVAKRTLNTRNVEFSVSSFEDFVSDTTFDVVMSFANHHTYDGNTHQSLDEYFAKCHALTSPGGTLLFESHPPALEGMHFAKTVAIIERYFTITESEIHQYGTFLDRDRRFIVGTRRDVIAPLA